MMAEEEWTMMTGGLAERAADRAAYDDYLAAMASDNSAFRAAFRDAFFEALREEMTDRQYEVLWMREVEGLSGKEIAYKLGISQSAVSRHLTRGKRHLRRLLAYNLELRNKIFTRAGKNSRTGILPGRLPFCAGKARLCFL